MSLSVTAVKIRSLRPGWQPPVGFRSDADANSATSSGTLSAGTAVRLLRAEGDRYRAVVLYGGTWQIVYIDQGAIDLPQQIIAELESRGE